MCHCWQEKVDKVNLEIWGRSSHRCAAGKTQDRWRSQACVAHCGSGCGIAPKDCAVG